MDTQSGPVLTIDEHARRRFEAAWLAGRPEVIAACLPTADHPHHLATLEELVHIDLEFRWRAAAELDIPGAAH